MIGVLENLIIASAVIIAIAFIILTIKVEFRPSCSQKRVLEGGAVKSTPTKNYTEVIEVSLPIKFYWTEDGFDGVSFSHPFRELFEWEQEMLDKCIGAIK